MREILVIDDHPIIVFSIERIISGNFPGYKVLSLSETDSIINYIYNNNPCLIILDLNMDDINPTELIKIVKRMNQDLPVLVFSSNSERTHGRFFLKQGAKGFLNKESSSDEIVHAIKKVLEGEIYLSETLAQMMANDLIENKNSSVLEKITEREYDILLKLIKGMSSSEIANELNLKPQTVTTFKYRIFEKLSVNNIIELYELVKLNIN